MNVQPGTYRPDPFAWRQRFYDIAADMARSDAKLEDRAAQGRRLGSGWDSWCKYTAQSLLAARDAYAILMPEDQPMIDRLGIHVVDLASAAANAARDQGSLGPIAPEWTTNLDAAIADAWEATDRLSRLAGVRDSGARS